MLSEAYRAGKLEFCVESESDGVISHVDELFSALPRAGASGSEISLFALAPFRSSAESELFELRGPTLGAVPPMPLATAIAVLVTAVSRAALDAEPERLHVHAAGAVRHEQAAILAAPRETGKTTTLARLILRGWECISDEAVSIGPRDTDVRGFAKPLSIKPGGRPFVPELGPHLLPRGTTDADSILHFSPTALGGPTRDHASPHLIVLLKRSRTGAASSPEATSRPIHPADAVVGLMAETMDAGRFGAGAVVELARLAARCLCQELDVGSPESTADVIERLSEQPSPVPLPVEELHDGIRMSPQVVSLLLDDRAVIHRQPEGHVLALDAMASRIWLKLGGWDAATDIDFDGPVVKPFVDQLRSLGLLHDGVSQ